MHMLTVNYVMTLWSSLDKLVSVTHIYLGVALGIS
jgi:hypothetical protein